MVLIVKSVAGVCTDARLLEEMLAGPGLDCAVVGADCPSN